MSKKLSTVYELPWEQALVLLKVIVNYPSLASIVGVCIYCRAKEIGER